MNPTDKSQIRESRAEFDDLDIADALEFCKQKVIAGVSGLIDQIMDSAEIAFDQRSRDPKEPDQALWKSSMGLLHNQHLACKQRFAEYFGRCFDAEDARACWKADTASGGSFKLELIDTQVFEQELLVERMAVRTGIDTQLHFNHLNRRLCFLLNRRIKPVDNALGPHLVARMMLKTFSGIGLQHPALYQLIRTMEEHFTDGLGQLYADMNEDFIRRGILPDIKHHIWRTADTLHGGRGKSRAAMTESQRQAMAAKQEALAQQDVGGVLAELSGLEPDERRDSDLGREFKQTGSRLLAAMDHLEAEMDGSRSLVETLSEMEQDQPGEKMDATTRKVMASADALASAFQRPFRRNPSSLQASLAGRMTLHIGRMALVDPAFLVDKNHPARKALVALRQFADYLEIADPGLSQVMVGRFEDYLGQYEAACADQESMEDLQVFLEKELQDWKAAAKFNLQHLDAWFSSFARICDGRDQLQAELAEAGSEPEFELFARLQLQAELNASDRARPSLDDIRAEYESAGGKAAVRAELAKAGLLGTLLQLEASGKSLGLVGQSHFEKYPASSVKDFASVVETLKPGTWVQDLERQDEMQLPELKRFFRPYNKGRWCVFVDGMGEYAGALSASSLRNKIETGLVKPLELKPAG